MQAAPIQVKWLAPALFATALAVGPALAEDFRIPSSSMKPTLLPGDVVPVVKYPKANVPARGDIVAFRVPKQPSTTFLFRVIGLPGESVQVIKGVLQINGEPVKREQVADFADKEDGKITSVKRWRETLPNGVTHETLDLVENGPFDNTVVFNVPAGHIFVMGDSRDNAQDSRLGSTGFIPLGNVVGRIERPAKKT